MTDTSPDQGIDKKCKDCGKSPPDVVFGKHKYNTKNGAAYYQRPICNSCESLRFKQYRQANSAKIAEKKQKHHEKHYGTIKYHVQEKIATWRKASNVPSNLTVDYLIDLYNKQDGLCYYSGEKMIFGWVNGKVQHNSLSLDKLDPDKGYVQENVVWCSYLANTMKQNMTKSAFSEYINRAFQEMNMYIGAFGYMNGNSGKILSQRFDSEQEAFRVMRLMEDSHRKEGYDIDMSTTVIKAKYKCSSFFGIGRPGPNDIVHMPKMPNGIMPDDIVFARYDDREFSSLREAIIYAQSIVDNYKPLVVNVTDNFDEISDACHIVWQWVPSEES